ncbi:MAG: substrate-binding domain-containing protein [Pirellulales bacterium]|nr:substrate-binding domain-containing protein [Pirellulales bacterium]
MSLLTLTPSKQFTPKYVDLARDLMREIAAGPLKVGDRLGTEQEISRRFSLSRVTVRQALELMEKEGYVTRRRARGTFVARVVEPARQFGLSGGRVLLVCSNEQRCHSDEDSAFCTVLRAIEQSLAQRHFAVQILSVGQNPRDDRQRLASLLARDELKAVLSIGPCLEPYADLLTDVKVVTSCSFYPTAFPWVGDDVALASYQSVRHLLDHGHRQIAMLCGSWIDGAAFASFADGFLRAMEEGAASPDRALMMHAYPGESLEELAIATLSRREAPTAVFCENSRVCQAVIKAASQLGLLIPGDLSVVGYGQNVCEIHEPVAITAYVPETAKVGEHAVALLSDLIVGKVQKSDPIVVPGRLVERSSVATLGR